MKYYVDLTIHHPDVSVFGGHKTSTLRITYELIQIEYLDFILEENPSNEEDDGVVHILRVNANIIEVRWLERFSERFIEVTRNSGLCIKFGERTWSIIHPVPIDE